MQKTHLNICILIVLLLVNINMYAIRNASKSPKKYTCYKTSQHILIDGIINDSPWNKADWTDAFIDIEGLKKPTPKHNTKVKMLWDDSCLYVAAYLEEHHIWATLTERESIIYLDNDFEVFIDPDNDGLNYFELEINALGTVWDLMLTKAYNKKR